MESLINLLSYEFMRKAFVIGSLLAIILPCIGFTVVLKRVSMIGETLSHSSLAGVAFGLFVGINPILGSILACLIASLGTEFLRERLKSYQEISALIMLSASIGLAGIFTSFLKNTNSIGAYLFGSIVTISDLEFYLVIGISVFVLLTYRFLYDKLYLSVFDSNSAGLLGINSKLLNVVFTFLIAVAVSISAKTIGSLIVSSLLVIPVVSAMQYAKTYKNTLILSMVFSFIFVNSGIIISYYFDLKPGSTIVLISVLSLVVCLVAKSRRLA